MPVSQRDHSLGSGVYFKPSDYIGLGPRILIFFVDAVVLLLLIGSLSWGWFSSSCGCLAHVISYLT